MEKIRAFYNNEILSAPVEFNFAKKSQLYFTKSRRVRIQNSGVKAGGERLVWPFASLADSLIHVRFYSAAFKTFFNRLIKKLKSSQRGLSKFNCNVRIFTVRRQRANRRVELEAQNGATAKFTQSRAWCSRSISFVDKKM